jgi:homoserine O-acetyltransferase
MRIASLSSSSRVSQMPMAEVDELDNRSIPGLPPSKSYYPSYSPEDMSVFDDEELEDAMQYFDVWPCGRDLLIKQLEGPEPHYDRVNVGFEVFKYQSPFSLQYKEGSLPEFDLAYETWGTLNADKSNAILLHTGLSASSHAKSHDKNPNPGWWEKFIGPGKAVDTNKFFVICANVLGGCYGSTGPSSFKPGSQRRYGLTFPLISVFDIVKSQFLLLDSFGIDRLHASVGSSLGGMQSLAAAAMFPERVARCISISACGRTYPFSIALRYAQRRVLMADPNWNGGNYYGKVFPKAGMKHAREIGTISYRSGPEWDQRFGRKRANPETMPNLCPDFLIETYLDHQGEQFSLRYDPNSLLYISKAMDLFDLADLEEGDYEKALTRIECPTLVMGVHSDILFPIWQQQEIAQMLRDIRKAPTTYYELNALYGHDTFLIDLQTVGAAVKGHLETQIWH